MTRIGVDLERFNEGVFELTGDIGTVGYSLPLGDRLDLIAFSCTSGTVTAGADFIAKGFASSHPNVPVINPATSAVAELKSYGVNRIALLTPYPTEIHSLFPPFSRRPALQ